MTETLPPTHWDEPFAVRELARATAHPHTLGPNVRARPRTHRPRPRGRLPAARERELVMAAREGGAEERGRLVEGFLPLIAGIARTYRTARGIDRNELMQDGVVGLLRALERYDPAQGTPFWVYASWWVRQAMQQLVSELAGPVVLSDRALRQLARIKDIQRSHLQAHGREPSLGELAARTGLPREQVGRLIAAHRIARTLDEPAAGDDGSASTLRELVADPCAEDAFERVRHFAAVHLPDLLGRLNERERKIIRARYGFDGRERTLREIAEELGVSAERVRQIEEASMRKLREAVDSPSGRGAHRDPSSRPGKHREVIGDAAASMSDRQAAGRHHATRPVPGNVEHIATTGQQPDDSVAQARSTANAVGVGREGPHRVREESVHEQGLRRLVPALPRLPARLPATA